MPQRHVRKRQRCGWRDASAGLGTRTEGHWNVSCSMWADERRVLSVVARELRVMGPAMVTRPSRWPGKLFRGERGKFIHRNVLFLRKLGKNQTNCPYTTAFSEIVKIPLKAKGGIGRGTRGMFLLVPRRRSSNNSANCLVGFFRAEFANSHRPEARRF